jgi:uncharacterized phage protein (TIGR02220 family)
MGKQTFYFSHDYNARNDEKIKELIFEHGMEGYGIYWSIIEELYLNANVLHLKYERIGFELRSDLNRIKSIINDYDLFVFSGENFGSLSVQKRLEEREEKSKKATASVNKRWLNTNVLRNEYECNTIKEIKVNKKDIYADESASIDFDKFIIFFNSFAKRNFRVTEKLKRTLKARLKNYSKEQIQQAIQNAHKEDYHITTNFKYLTPELILREDKLERFINNPKSQNNINHKPSSN